MHFLNLDPIVKHKAFEMLGLERCYLFSQNEKIFYFSYFHLILKHQHNITDTLIRRRTDSHGLCGEESQHHS